MSKKTNHVKLSGDGKVSFLLDQQGINEYLRALESHATNGSDILSKIRSSLMLELWLKAMPKTFFVKDYYTITMTVAQALAFFWHTNANDGLMDISPNLRIVNNQIHQRLVI